METLSEFEIILNLVNANPNDSVLGGEYRKFSLYGKGLLDEYCLEYPNDSELGYFLRKNFKNSLSK